MIVLQLLCYDFEGELLSADISFDSEIEDVPLMLTPGIGVSIGMGFIIDGTVSFAIVYDGDRFSPNVDITGDTPREVIIVVTLSDDADRVLKLSYRVEFHDVALVPPLTLRPRSLASASLSAAVSVSMLQSATSTVSNAINEETNCFYIAQPTNYSGDKWHIAIALILDKRCKVIILKRNATQKEKQLAKSYADIYEQLGAKASRILTGAAGKNMQQISPNYWRNRAVDYAKKDQDPTVKSAKRIVRMTFASTSVIMRAVEAQGVEAVRTIIRDAFAGQLTSESVRARIRARVAFLESLGKCVIVNMRCAHYHFEHNITAAIYDQVAAVAEQMGLIVIRAGIYEPDYHPISGAWMARFRDAEFQEEPRKQRFIDVYGSRDERTDFRVNEFETAYLWACVSQMQNVVGIIGGRSGSLDVAAFMGVRTLSWDIVDNDREYIRMLLAFPLMSCIRRAGLGNTLRQRPKKMDEPDDGLLAGGLETLAMAVWLSGREVIPDHLSWQLLPRNIVEDELEFERLQFLEFLLQPDVESSDEEEEEDDEEQEDDEARKVKRSRIEQTLAQETRSEIAVFSARYGRLTIGEAVDNGDCCFDTTRQLLPAIRRPANVATNADLRQFLASYYRNTLNDELNAQRVEAIRAYVTVDDIKVLVRALNASGADIEIVIHYNAYGSTEVVPMESGHGGGGPILHFLFAVDENGNGHISPLR